MKRIVFRLLYLLGIPSLLRFVHRNSLTILLYHGVAPRAVQGIFNYRGKFITPESFEWQVRYLKKHYTILPLEEAVERMQRGTLPPYALALTFDDGYRNFYDYALPILRRYNAPVTMYLATDFVCKKIPLWVDRLEYAIGKTPGTQSEHIALDMRIRNTLKTLDSDAREAQLKKVEESASRTLTDFADDRSVYAPLSIPEITETQSATITYGAHTQSHPILARLDRSRQKVEIVESKKTLETHGVYVSAIFAYPNGQSGDWTADTEATLLEAGFSHALTTLEGTNTRHAHPYRLHRMTVDAAEEISTFANIVTGVRLFIRSLTKV